MCQKEKAKDKIYWNARCKSGACHPTNSLNWKKITTDCTNNSPGH